MVSLRLLGAIGVSFLSTASCLPKSDSRQASSWPTFTDATIFTPGPNYTTPRVLYTRTAMIGDTILATWENYSPEPPPVYFPIYQSTDGGQTWSCLSEVNDQVNGWGLRYQPMLYVLPQDIGAYPAGTLLLAGNSIPTDLSQTKIDVYASPDNGKTWSFVSNVASGGAAIPDNGIPAIWEPFLMVYNDQLVIYYSDQRDPDHGQKLVHQTTTDLLTWTSPVDDVAYPTYTDRPGMTTVTLLPNGQYMMTYEYGGGPTAVPSNYSFPVYYRLNADPLSFASSPGLPLISTDAVQPTSSPYITWTPAGNAANGTILVSSGNSPDLFTNTMLGAQDAWVRISTPAPAAYTRSLRVLPDMSTVLITGAGTLPPSNNTKVRADAIGIGCGVACGA